MNTAHFFEILGIAGSLIMCASSVPQIMKTYRTKSVDSLSGFLSCNSDDGDTVGSVIRII